MANKKAIVGGILILGVVLAAEPIVASYMIQDQMSTVTEEIGKHPLITVLESRYEKGLYGGEGMTKLHLTDTPEQNVYSFKHEVSTAPIFRLSNGTSATGIAHIRTTLILDEEKDREEMLKVFAGAEPVIDTVVSFGNNIKVYFNVPEVNLDNEVAFTNPMGVPAKKTTSIHFSGLNSEMDVSSDGGHMSGVLKMPAFSVKEVHDAGSQSMEFKLDNISSTFNATKVTQNLYTGEGDLKVALIDIGNAMMPVTLSDSQFSYRVGDKKETFDYEIDASIAKIASPTGMPLPINRFESKFALRNLDIQAFEHYMIVLQGEAKKGQPMDFELMLPQLLDIADMFLQRNLVVEEVMKVGTEQGDGNVDIHADFKALEAGMSTETMDPMTGLLPRTSAEIKVNIPKALLDMTPLAPQVAQFIQVGYIKEDDKNYFSHAQFKDMKLTLNGIEVALPPLGNDAAMAQPVPTP